MPSPAAAPRATRVRWHRGWYVYDWASSAYATAIIAVFLGPFLTDLARAGADADGVVRVLGLAVRPGAVFPFAVAAAVLVSVAFLLILGPWVDITGRAVRALGMAAYVGSAATALIAVVAEDAWLLGAALLVVSSVALTSSYAIYNAFLPRIATPEESDTVSSRGWALGYVGGGIVLGAGLVIEAQHEALGLSADTAVRLAFVLAGLWWGGFTIITLRALRSVPWPPVPHSGSAASAGLRRLRDSLGRARHNSVLVRFLIAYLCYNQGVQTVFAVVALYAVEELGFVRTQLLPGIAAVMVLAFVGSLAMARVARRVGSRRTVTAMLAVWTVVVVIAALTPAGVVGPFLAAAAVGGFIVGATQALSRSIYARLVPAGEEAEWFSLYQLGDRGTAWLGPLLFGVLFQLTGSYRPGMMTLAVFFATGMFLLMRLRLPAHGAEPPTTTQSRR